MQITPRRKDAGLIVGIYRYIVASLSMPLRWAAYGGLRRRTRTGLKLVEGAAAYVDNQEPATLVVSST
jgi:hypothetical protein